MTDNNTTKAVIEALLFVSEKPLTIEQIRKVLDSLGSDEVRLIIGELAKDYEEANRGIRIVEIAGGFQMITPPILAPFLKKLYKEKRQDKLSRPALETLAIIAYKQPVTKSEIESLRNVNVDGVISSLLDKELIRIAGRKKIPGRPYVFGTTREFLECFGLKSLDELPKKEEFTLLAQKSDIEIINEEKPQTMEESDDSQRPA
ncbi:SMC-Scp complex subunit ScpB [bacterium]|nr:MAG: SMC-Scp complex subunit ScpB [bacterium]